jgi:hypothetical protein
VLDDLAGDPTSAAHALGKLVRHVGEDNVLWGTDSIWYGSPQDQIQAFRAFQISDALVQQHGYKPLIPSLKAKIFGLSGAKFYGVDPAAVMRRADADRIGRLKRTAESDPSFMTYGPHSDTEYEAFLAAHGGTPL